MLVGQAVHFCLCVSSSGERAGSQEDLQVSQSAVRENAATTLKEQTLHFDARREDPPPPLPLLISASKCRPGSQEDLPVSQSAVRENTERTGGRGFYRGWHDCVKQLSIQDCLKSGINILCSRGDQEVKELVIADDV